MVFPFECPVCRHKTNMPQTNADRIRNMSDAQLVQMLTIGRGGFSCSKCAESEDCGQNCEVQCLKWLQQPAEKSDNETVDAVPVVRCKDCKYGEVDDADLPTQYLCNYHGADWNDENPFCSYGERKDGDDNG